MASTKSISKKARVPKIHQHYRGALFSFVSKPQLKGKEVTLPNGSRTELAMVRHSGSIAIVPLLDDRYSWIFGICRGPIKYLINKALERFGEVFVFVVDHVKFAGHGWIGERDGHESAGLDFLPGHLS